MRHPAQKGLNRLVIPYLAAACLLLAGCAVPLWNLEGFERLDLAGFKAMDHELALFANRSASPAFFDTLMSRQGSQAGLPSNLNNPQLKERLRQILVLRNASSGLTQGLVSLDAPNTLVIQGLGAAGFTPVPMDFVSAWLMDTATAQGDFQTAAQSIWYAKNNLFITLPAEGLLVFQMGSMTAYAPAAQTGPGDFDLSGLKNFAQLSARAKAFASGTNKLSRPPATTGAAANQPQRVLRADLDLSASGVAGKILGALVLKNLSIMMDLSEDKKGMDCSFVLQTPQGSGTALVKKAVRLWFLGMSNRLGLADGALQALQFDTKDDTLSISGLHLNQIQALDLLGLLMGSSGI